MMDVMLAKKILEENFPNNKFDGGALDKDLDAYKFVISNNGNDPLHTDLVYFVSAKDGSVFERNFWDLLE